MAAFLATASVLMLNTARGNTVGVLDPSSANDIDIPLAAFSSSSGTWGSAGSTSIVSLATFRGVLGTAFTNNLGGVEDLEGRTIAANAAFTIAYGANTLNVAAGSYAGTAVSASEGRVAVSGTNQLASSSGLGVSFNVSLSNAGDKLTGIGFAWIERNRATKTNVITVTVTLDNGDSVSAIVTNNTDTVASNEDAFFGFLVPTNRSITALSVSTSQSFFNMLDDLGFIVNGGGSSAPVARTLVALLDPRWDANDLDKDAVFTGGTGSGNSAALVLSKAAARQFFGNAYLAGQGGVEDFETRPVTSGQPFYVVYGPSDSLVTITGQHGSTAGAYSGGRTPISGSTLLQTSDGAHASFQFTPANPSDKITQVGLGVIERNRTTTTTNGTERVVALMTATATLDNGDTITSTNLLNTDAIDSNEDTFVGFSSPAGRSITSLAISVATLPLSDGSTPALFPVLDDLAFAVNGGGNNSTPAIFEYRADNTIVVPNQPVTLNWLVTTNLTSLVLNPGGINALASTDPGTGVGSLTFAAPSVAGTNAYILSAANGSGSLSATSTVTVVNQPAFPGAEGAGAGALGGRGGDVYYVTTLADSGPGSLREGIATAPASGRNILFKVSGTIFLNSQLSINKSRLTIAGQTAPGDGITLAGWTTSVGYCRDVVVRFIRCRAGDLNCTAFQEDSCRTLYATNVVLDHVSASWSVDETLSASHSTNVTVQWSLITESLNNSCHYKGEHGCGSLISGGAGAVTFHHNLYAHHANRIPRPGDNLRLDFVNNVIFNWTGTWSGGAAGYNADDLDNNPGGYTNFLNYVGNYLVAGPSTPVSHSAFASYVPSANSCRIFQSGNLIDGNLNGLVDGSDTGWGMFSGPYRQRSTRCPVPPVDTDSAPTAYERVLAFGGASFARDAVDRRIIAGVRNQTGAIINSQNSVGGFPLLNSTSPPVDTDNDGMPDYWEESLGLNPANSADGNRTNVLNGYTRLEEYLNWLASPHALCSPDGQTNVNLEAVCGGNTNLTFSVFGASSGSVVLLDDGHTVRFTAAANHVGLAGFSFAAADVSSGRLLGTNQVSVLVTGTAALPVISYTVNNGSLTLSWPDINLGWVLQIKTGSPDSGGWSDLGMTASVTSISLPFLPVNEPVFYRLRRP